LSRANLAVNLFDEAYDAGAIALSPPSRVTGGDQIGMALGNPGAPCTVVVSLRYDFSPIQPSPRQFKARQRLDLALKLVH
jgi:hypothetical protein